MPRQEQPRMGLLLSWAAFHPWPPAPVLQGGSAGPTLWPKPEHGLVQHSAVGVIQERQKNEASSMAAAQPSYNRSNKAVF